ncbi:MAG: hypothetical protein IPL26_05385 [Leptospiraceae bacterium]|nr:hypothetical protein [Leptospiraceae bacterium]
MKNGENLSPADAERHAQLDDIRRAQVSTGLSSIGGGIVRDTEAEIKKLREKTPAMTAANEGYVSTVSYSDVGFLQSLGERLSNWQDGFQMDNQIVMASGEKGGLQSALQTLVDRGQATSAQKEQLKVLNELADSKKALLSKYANSNPGEFNENPIDFEKMNKNTKDKEDYVNILKQEFAFEEFHSKDLMRKWKEEGRTEVPLTPWLKKTLTTEIDLFGNPFNKLDLDNIKIRNGGLGTTIEKLIRIDFDFEKLMSFENPFIESPTLFSTPPDAKGEIIYNLREMDDGKNKLGDAEGKNEHVIKQYATQSSDSGGVRQFDLYDIGVLSHELTHSIQALNSEAWDKMKSINDENIETLRKIDRFASKYGISRERLGGLIYNNINSNPRSFIGHENELFVVASNRDGVFLFDEKGKLKELPITSDTRADINRAIIINKLNYMRKLGILNEKGLFL